MKHCRILKLIMNLFFVSLSTLFLIPEAYGGLILEAGIRGIYEDNINGSPEDADKKGDFYTVLSASAGGYKEVASKTFLFLRADAASYLYSKYDDLDSTMGDISAGMYKGLNDWLSAQLMLKARIKDYRGDPRDSVAYGGNLELTQWIKPELWIKEGYVYEKNDADSNLFSYHGHLFGIWAGYHINPKTMVNLGYSFLTRKYEDSFGFRTKTHTISAGFVRELVKRVYFTVGYDRQFNNSNVPDTGHTNNIYTIGVIYSF